MSAHRRQVEEGPFPGRPARDPIHPASVEVGGPAARMLDLQRTAGNGVVTALLAGRPASTRTLRPVRTVATPARGEDGDEPEDAAVPDWDAPIEAEADERTEARSEAGSRIQRHGDQDLPPERSETAGFSILAGGVQRQAPAVKKTVFPAFNNVQWNAAVRTAAWKAWKETLNATTKTTRREQGFWVQWDRTTLNNANGTYKTVGHVTGAAVGPAAGATIALGAKPADTGDWRTVASFHTHTPTRFRPVGRIVGPSGADGAADTSDNVTGLVYDYIAVKGGAVPKGHPLWSSARIYHSGPKRRT